MWKADRPPRRKSKSEKNGDRSTKGSGPGADFCSYSFGTAEKSPDWGDFSAAFADGDEFHSRFT
jgi:hypothetical protein